MISKPLKTAILSSVILFASCKEEPKAKANDKTMTENVLLQEWTGPYQGVPNLAGPFQVVPNLASTSATSKNNFLGVPISTSFLMGF